MGMRHVEGKGVGEDVELVAHVRDVTHVLHLVVSVADEPLIVQRHSVPTPQKVVGLLLVVGNAAELCDRKRTV